MAFVIEITAEGSEPHYWIGGEIFSVFGDQAARFVGETDAELTIDLLKRTAGISPTARVVDLKDVMSSFKVDWERNAALMQ